MRSSLPPNIDVDDRSPRFLSFWAQAREMAEADRRWLWSRDYEAPNRDFFDVYFDGWARRAEIDPALECFASTSHSIRERSARFVDLIPEVATQTASRFRVSADGLRFVVFVGVFSSNGWTAVHHDVPTVFFALERVPDPPIDAILVAHETTHLLHARERGDWGEETIALALFAEGLATAASAAVVAGRTQSEYLWSDPGFDSWADACEAHLPAVRDELASKLELTDRETYARFFRGGGSTHHSGELPERIGYFVGFRVMHELQNAYPLEDLLTWSSDRAARAVRELVDRV